MAQLKHLGMTGTKIGSGEIERRLNLGNVYYESVQDLLSPHLLSKNIKFTIYKTLILPVVVLV
jgi:hypothetical protein